MPSSVLAPVVLIPTLAVSWVKIPSLGLSVPLGFIPIIVFPIKPAAPLPPLLFTSIRSMLAKGVYMWVEPVNLVKIPLAGVVLPIEVPSIVPPLMSTLEPVNLVNTPYEPVNTPPVIFALEVFNVLNVPIAGVEPPITVESIVPPLISTLVPVNSWKEPVSIW